MIQYERLFINLALMIYGEPVFLSADEESPLTKLELI